MCVANDGSSPSPAVCTVTPPENGLIPANQISPVVNSMVLEGGVVTFACNDGFRLNGNEVGVCVNGELEFGGLPPTCTSQVTTRILLTCIGDILIQKRYKIGIYSRCMLSIKSFCFANN